MKNLYDDTLEKPAKGFESFQTLLEHKNIKIQKILSCDYKNGHWYEQAEDEWVVLLQGEATLEYSDSTQKLSSGDFIFIPRTTKHRVVHTSKDALWLALFIA